MTNQEQIADQNANTKWTVSIGSDDPYAVTFNNVIDAESHAIKRSVHAWTKVAYVNRIGGQHIRQYTDGVLTAYLAGSGTWVEGS